MCLGVPMQVMTIDGETALCEVDGVRREASLALIDRIEIGDFVLIHAGFAIEKVDATEAEETLRIFRRLLAEGMGPE